MGTFWERPEFKPKGKYLSPLALFRHFLPSLLPPLPSRPLGLEGVPEQKAPSYTQCSKFPFVPFPPLLLLFLFSFIFLQNRRKE